MLIIEEVEHGNLCTIFRIKTIAEIRGYRKKIAYWYFFTRGSGEFNLQKWHSEDFTSLTRPLK
jgi:hypothetical protein